MIKETWRVPSDHRGKRYVKRAIGDLFYRWCEQNQEDLRYDMAQGTCDAEDLPADILKKCNEHVNGHFYACEWPFDEIKG